MGIRVARAEDIPRLFTILKAAFERSKYVGRGKIDANYTKRLLLEIIARQTEAGEEQTFPFVYLEDGIIRGMHFAIKQRIYNLGYGSSPPATCSSTSSLAAIRSPTRRCSRASFGGSTTTSGSSKSSRARPTSFPGSHGSRSRGCTSATASTKRARCLRAKSKGGRRERRFQSSR
jgi:hypothetical protein